MEENDPSTILCCAPTASGKTTLGIHAVKLAHFRHKRIIYTAPIKSLSNQIFYDLSSYATKLNTAADPLTVGLITGDHRCNPDATCLIMTTEILRNALDRDESNTIHIDWSTVGAVILDEVHYINDPDRGHVWEEVIMKLPLHVSLVCLSATIQSPSLFLDWIKSVRSIPSLLVTVNTRKVPLQYYGLLQLTDTSIKLNSDQRSLLNHEVLIMNTTTTKTPTPETYKMLALHNQLFTNGYVKPHYYTTENVNNLVSYLENKKWLPAIIFLLSKQKCHQLASLINVSFNTDEEQKQVGHFIRDHMRLITNATDYISTPEYTTFLDQATRGIGVHHSGQYPLFKELIELLAKNNLIKLLIATETFAVGINLPTKTVVFTSLSKFQNGGHRWLHSHEFIQMSGRAGRRGLDTLGNVIIWFNTCHKMDVNAFNQIASGNSQILSSKFKINPYLILHQINKNDSSSDIINKSMFWKEQITQSEYMQSQLEQLKNMLKPIETQPWYTIQNKLDEYVKIANNNALSANQQMKKIAKMLKDTPSIKTHFEQYNKYCKQIQEIHQYELEYNKCVHYDSIMFDKMTHYLRHVNMINSEDKLTPNGKVCLHMDEIYGVIQTRIILDSTSIIHKCTNDELILFVSLFMENSQDDDDESKLMIREEVGEFGYVLNYVEHVFNEVKKTELENDIINLPNELNYSLLIPLSKWLKGYTVSDICTTGTMYVGNFIKDINRVKEMATQWAHVARMVGYLELANNFDTAASSLIHNVAVLDSLYIKLSN
jgi:ATP-dependent RNA helicase DOB1